MKVDSRYAISYSRPLSSYRIYVEPEPKFKALKILGLGLLHLIFVSLGLLALFLLHPILPKLFAIPAGLLTGAFTFYRSVDKGWL